MKTLRAFFVVAAVAGFAAPAAADSPVSARVFDQGRHVLVEIDGLAASAPIANTRGDRIEVPVANGLAHGGRLEVEDKTIKRVFFETNGVPRVSIQMRHGRSTTEKLAAGSIVEQAGGTLRIRVPRRRRHISGATPEAPVALQTELVDGPARAVAPPSAPQVAVAPAAAPPTPAAPAAAPPATAAAVPEPVAAAAPVPATPAKTAAPEAAPTAPTETAKQPAPSGADDTVAALGATDGAGESASKDDAGAAGSIGGATGGGGNLGLVILILGACAGAAWFARRRSQQLPAVDPALSIIAEKTLGARAKVVLLSAGDREILLSVGDKDGPTLLGQWACGESRPAIAEDLEPVVAPQTPAEAETAQDKLASLRRAAFGTAKQPVVGNPKGTSFKARLDKARSTYSRSSTASTVNVESPAIAGILKLRGNQPVLSQEMTSADPDADAEWAAELLAATAARGGRN